MSDCKNCGACSNHVRCDCCGACRNCGKYIAATQTFSPWPPYPGSPWIYWGYSPWYGHHTIPCNGTVSGVDGNNGYSGTANFGTITSNTVHLTGDQPNLSNTGLHHVTVSAIDAKSFTDNAHNIADAVTAAIHQGHPLSAEIRTGGGI